MGYSWIGEVGNYTQRLLEREVNEFLRTPLLITVFNHLIK